MKTCSLLWLAIIVFICWVSITQATEQSYGRSGYQIETCQSCKKCPAYDANQSKCTDKKYKYINVPVSAAGVLDICRICEIGMLRFSNKKPPFRCGANELSDELNFVSSGYADNVDAYGRAGLNADRKTGVDAAFYDNGGGGVYGKADYLGGEGLFTRAGYGNVPMFNQEAQFGRQNPHFARTIVAPELLYSPVVYEPSAVYVPSTSYRPAGVGGAVGVTGEVGLNAGIGVGGSAGIGVGGSAGIGVGGSAGIGVSGSAGILGHLFGRAGSEDRSSANIERTYNNENKIDGPDDVGSDTVIAGQDVTQEQDSEAQDKFKGLRQRYDFGLG